MSDARLAGARRGGRAVLAGIAGLAALLYPAAVYFGISRGGWQILSVGLLLFLAARVALQGPAGPTRRLAAVPAAAALGLAGAALLSGIPDFLLYYPVAVNGALLALFAASLRNPPSIVERLARLRHPDLPPSGVAWTRKVTMVWCGFFAANGAIALATAAWGDLELWALYNGLIAYVAIGTLMGGEFVARQFALRRGDA